MLSFTILGSVLLVMLLLGCGPDSPFFIPNPYRGSTPYDYKGGNLVRFSQCGELIYNPEWSPDGKKILYRQGGREKRGLWIIDLEGEEETPRQIFSPSEGSIFSPHWSPDGQQILFTYSYGRGADSRDDIAIVNSDGSNFRILVKDAYAGCWMPDGERIIYAKARHLEIKRVFLYNLKTKKEKCLTPSGYKTLWICEVSPQGDKLLLAHDVKGSVRDSQLHILDISAGEEYWLCSGNDGAWSPDGKRIVYVSFAPRALSVVNRDGTPSSILEEKCPGATKYLNLCYNPDWSPDGRKIVFTADKVIGQYPGRTSSELFILYLDPSLIPGKKGGGE
jgi:Tol biopolymer transport system component